MDGGMDALLEQLKLASKNVWKRRWTVMAISALTAVITCGLATLSSDRYQVSSRVYVDTQTVLKPLMVGLAYQPDIEQQVRMLARTLVSRPNVERILDAQDFGWNVKDPSTRDKVISDLMEKIPVETGGASNLYVVTYRDISQERARRVVQAVVDFFVDSNSDAKRRDSQDASRFINDQIKEYESKLIEAENRVKEFKVRNFGVTGTQSQDYFGRMSSLSDQVTKSRMDLAAAERSRDAYRHELAAEDPQLPVAEMPTQASFALPSEVDSRLEAQKKLLDDLLRRYTDVHPDVIAARRVIAQIESQKQQEAQARSSGAGSRRSSAATSPVYQHIRVALAEAEAKVASLRSQLGGQQAQLDATRGVASRVPQVESELAQLNRDYDVIRKNYDLLVARRESASLGIKLDESSQLADFRVIEPPRVAPKPVFPARIHLGLFAIVLSVVSGVASVVAWDMLRPTFRDVKSLAAATGRPVLGSISVSLASVTGGRSSLEIAKFVTVAASVLVLQVGWLLWLASRPLT